MEEAPIPSLRVCDYYTGFLMIPIWTRPLIGAQKLRMGQIMARSPASAQ